MYSAGDKKAYIVQTEDGPIKQYFQTMNVIYYFENFIVQFHKNRE